MKFPRPLKTGLFLKRYKRFFADIEYEGETLTAHCPNTGSMKGCNIPGSPCLFSTHDDPKRKLKHTLEAVRCPQTGSWVGVNTGYPNRLLWEAFTERLLPSWEIYAWGQKEAKVNSKSRIDLVLCCSSLPGKYSANLLEETSCPQLHFVEIKNVTLGESGVALFPDAVTERGQKHIQELRTLMKSGHTAELVFVVQRQDCSLFRPAEDIDSIYARLLKEAYAEGLKISVYQCQFLPDELRLVPEPLQVEL